MLNHSINPDKSKNHISISSLNLKEKLDAACAYDGRKEANINLNNLENSVQVFEEGEEIIIPIVKEEIHIDKEIIESGKVRIIKTISEEKSSVEVPIKHTEVHVEHKPKNEYVDANHQAIRYEGDTMIVSVLKEVVVVQKKTLLVEELHITNTQKQEIYKEDVILKSEHISVERQNLDKI